MCGVIVKLSVLIIPINIPINKPIKYPLFEVSELRTTMLVVFDYTKKEKPDISIRPCGSYCTYIEPFPF